MTTTDVDGWKQGRPDKEGFYWCAGWITGEKPDIAFVSPSDYNWEHGKMLVRLSRFGKKVDSNLLIDSIADEQFYLPIEVKVPESILKIALAGDPLKK